MMRKHVLRLLLLCQSADAFLAFVSSSSSRLSPPGGCSFHLYRPSRLVLGSVANKKPKGSNNKNKNNNNNIQRVDKDDSSFTGDDDDDDSFISNNVNIPKTGVSLGDEIMESQATQFVTELEPWTAIPGLAKISTLPPFQPTRYIVPLYSAETLQQQPHLSPSFVLVDIPPFSQKLLSQILNHIGADSKSNSTTPNKGSPSLVAILLTSRDGIHYDQSPAVYVTRKSDLQKWKEAFPGIQVVMYRLDTPRDVNNAVTQKLDGYGPWAAWDIHQQVQQPQVDNPLTNEIFVETGRPLTRLEWNETIKSKVLDQGDSPPDDDHDNDDDLALYTPEAIRKREEGKSMLAIYTPGHTYGSVTYIFPDSKICCSGYTLPCEDTTRSNTANAGPILDYRGYLSTNKGSIERQVESGRHVIEQYSDRFHTVLPSIGRALFMKEKSIDERIGLLQDALDEWQELGKIYQDLGIL